MFSDRFIKIYLHDAANPHRQKEMLAILEGHYAAHPDKVSPGAIGLLIEAAAQPVYLPEIRQAAQKMVLKYAAPFRPYNPKKLLSRTWHWDLPSYPTVPNRQAVKPKDDALTS